MKNFLKKEVGAESSILAGFILFILGVRPVIRNLLEIGYDWTKNGGFLMNNLPKLMAIVVGILFFIKGIRTLRSRRKGFVKNNDGLNTGIALGLGLIVLPFIIVISAIFFIGILWSTN